MNRNSDKTSALRILVLRGGAIGDFVVTLPVLQALKQTWPDCHIVLVGYPHVARLALQCRMVDEVRSLDEVGMARFFSWRPEFDAEQINFVSSFDLVISFLHDPGDIVRQNLFRAGARQVIYSSPLVKRRHAVDQMLLALKDLPVNMEGCSFPRITLPEDRLRRGQDLAQEFGVSLPAVALHPGSGSPHKNWPLANYLKLHRWIQDNLKLDAFLILGEADEAIAQALRKLDYCPPTVSGLPLVDTAALLAASTAFVGNDSGITHIAAALSLPTVALFGPSDPDLWGPRGDAVTIIRAPNHDLHAIRVPEVGAALRAMLQKR